MVIMNNVAAHGCEPKESSQGNLVRNRKQQTRGGLIQREESICKRVYLSRKVASFRDFLGLSLLAFL